MTRNRLTISLQNKILKRVDECIDGSRIRNRSHAIEFILSKYFSPKIKKAVILAGGEGVKTQGGNCEIPKSMILVNNRPVLEHAIENLRRHDIREVLILIGHLGRKIKEYFGDGSKYGVKITYVNQGKSETGTAEPLLKAKNFVGKRSFFVFYGDVLASIDLTDMTDYHLASDSIVTMALTSVKKPSSWGVVRLKGSKVVSYLEKPNSRRDLSHLINSGIYIFEPKIFENIEKKARRLEKDVFPKIVDKNKMAGYIFDGQWFDVGNPRICESAMKEWKE